jgi:hypothetical protein
MSQRVREGALEGVLVLALFLTAVLGDIVTAEHGTSLAVQLRLTALLYAVVWAVRLAIRAVRSVGRRRRPSVLSGRGEGRRL